MIRSIWYGPYDMVHLMWTIFKFFSPWNSDMGCEYHFLFSWAVPWAVNPVLIFHFLLAWCKTLYQPDIDTWILKVQTTQNQYFQYFTTHIFHVQSWISLNISRNDKIIRTKTISWIWRFTEKSVFSDNRLKIENFQLFSRNFVT